MEEMTKEEFEEYCKRNDYNKVSNWNKDKFQVICLKCNSKNNEVAFREEKGKMGSEYTGYMEGFYNDNNLLVKCKDCGNTMVLNLVC